MRMLGLDVSLAAPSRGRPSKQEPQPQLILQPGYQRHPGTAPRPLPKPTPDNLRRFATTPPMRRAINAIKNPILGMDWGTRPRKGEQLTPERAATCKVIDRCIFQPNADDDWFSFAGKLLEDLMLGAGAIETQRNGDANHPWWFWTPDALSILVVPGWDGKPNTVRWAQRAPGVGATITLTDMDLIYLRPNQRSHTPFGLGPGEVAFNMVNAFLAANGSAHKLAANQLPGTIIDLGKDTKANEVEDFRTYWEDEIEGTGTQPIVGGHDSLKVVRMAQGTDQDLRIKWQEFLMLLIAISFDLSPGKLGLARDINRSTKEGMMEEDEEGAIIFWAKYLAAVFTRQIVWKRFGREDLEFGIHRRKIAEEEAQARIHQIYVTSGVLTEDEVRQDLNRGPKPIERGNVIGKGLDRVNRNPQANDDRSPTDPKPTP